MLDTLAAFAALLALLVAPAVGVLAAEHRSARRVSRLCPVDRDRGPRAITITDAHTGAAHLVTDAAVARGRPGGRYIAVRGTRVLAASLTAPAAGICRCCRPDRSTDPGRLSETDVRMVCRVSDGAPDLGRGFAETGEKPADSR